MNLRGSKTTATGPLFGDPKITGEALAAAMYDPETDPQTLALLIRDCGEAGSKVKPGSSWNPTLGFKAFWTLKVEFPKSTLRFKGGCFEAYEKLSATLAEGFTGSQGAVVPNGNFAGEAERNAEAVYDALSADPSVDLVVTRWRALARRDAKRGAARSATPADAL